MCLVRCVNGKKVKLHGSLDKEVQDFLTKCVILRQSGHYFPDLEIVVDHGSPTPSEKTGMAETFRLILRYFVVNSKKVTNHAI